MRTPTGAPAVTIGFAVAVSVVRFGLRSGCGRHDDLERVRRDGGAGIEVLNAEVVRPGGGTGRPAMAEENWFSTVVSQPFASPSSSSVSSTVVPSGPKRVKIESVSVFEANVSTRAQSREFAGTVKEK